MIKRLNSLGFNELVAEYTVTGSAVSNITFDGLDINADGGYTIVISSVSNVSTSEAIWLAINGDTTANNYTRRYITATGSSVYTGGDNLNIFSAVSKGVGTTCYTVAELTLINGYVCYNTNIQYWISGGVFADPHLVKHNVSNTNVTSLSFYATTSNSIGIGSKIQIYRWKSGRIKTLSALSSSPLVGFYEHAGAATSEITMSGLDIVSDGGYKIVVALVNGYGTASGGQTFINGDTTAANYSRRYIYSYSGSSLITNVESRSEAFGTNATIGSVSMSVINMSLVNGYMCLNGVQQAGDTSAALIYFVKKTASATNVTSITFKADSGTPIGAGSKFYIFRTN